MIQRFHAAIARLINSPLAPLKVLKQLSPPKQGCVHVAGVRDTIDDFLVFNWVVSSIISFVFAFFKIRGIAGFIGMVVGQAVGIALGFGFMCLWLWLVGKWDTWRPAAPIVIIIVEALGILNQLRGMMYGTFSTIIQGLFSIALTTLAIATVLSIPGADEGNDTLEG